MNSLFVTGTDTGVGKTVLTAALVAAARAGGQDVVPMKPVQTGCEPGADGGFVSPDLELVLSLAGLDAAPQDRERMSLFRFKDACSPHLAAAREDRPMRVLEIVTAYAQLASHHDAVVVEGAGGLLVPLNDEETMRDLAIALGLEVVIASRPGLGTLNHTLLTVESLRTAGVSVRAVVIVQSTPEPLDFIEQDNISALAQRAGVPVLGPLPFIPEINDPDFTPEDFLAIVRPVIAAI